MCKFFTETIDYLGHVICQRRFEVSPYTTDVIRGLRALTKLTELRSFWGLCNVFILFVPNFSRLAAPLTQGLKNAQSATFEPLTEEELNYINALIEAWILLPILALLYNCGHIILDKDACTVQISCVLLQLKPDKPAKPVGYWPGSITDAECKYDTTQRKFFCDSMAATVVTNIPRRNAMYYPDGL